MKQKTKIAAVSLAAVMACGIMAGCDLVTTDAFKDYEQVIAEVNIGNSESFKEGGKYAKYQSVVSTAEISKRDMVASFAASGSTVMSYYGWSYRDTFNAICESLVNRQIYVQYAKVYFLENNPEGETYTVSGYEAEVNKAESKLDKEIAGLTYFLTPDEQAKALYDLRTSFNTSLDTLEESIIEDTDEHDHDDTVRTTPTGVNTENADYYDEAYRIYTGTETSLGGYEKLDGSTSTTRRQAYAQFLSNIRSSGLLSHGENTSKIEELDYFNRELKSAYESALINKISDAYEAEAESKLGDDWLGKEFDTIYTNQKNGFEEGTADIDSALDSMSDTSFVLTAPQAGYGFVINILLPFSTMQSQELSDVNMDANDLKGNKFVTRANILSRVRATDQRGTWFSGHDDYSYEGVGYKGTGYLFFENSLSSEKSGEGNQYEALKNYYGKYNYNGTVTPPAEGEGNGHYKTTPTKIDIDGFIDEMEGYLAYAFEDAGVGASVVKGEKGGNAYYAQSNYYVNENGTGDVDYEKFVYYRGKVDFTDGFNANEIFLANSKENVALSVINELSFAYNTDTAGLNTYLGYAVTPDKTNFVSEFEYAAQWVCKEGAGNYIVVPSDYGWHIIYCTFSFTETNMKPFGYDELQRDVEGTFSNLFYEAKKSSAVSTYSSNKQTEIINEFAEGSATIYAERYEDLASLDLA